MDLELMNRKMNRKDERTVQGSYEKCLSDHHGGIRRGRCQCGCTSHSGGWGWGWAEAAHKQGEEPAWPETCLELSNVPRAECAVAACGARKPWSKIKAKEEASMRGRVLQEVHRVAWHSSEWGAFPWPEMPPGLEGCGAFGWSKCPSGNRTVRIGK